MSIVAQPRSRSVNALRIAIWSGFLLAVFLPILFDRSAHPYYGAMLLRPGAWILSAFGPRAASARGLTLINFFLYTAVIYAVLRLVRRPRQNP
jgi:hypothetical protein